MKKLLSICIVIITFQVVAFTQCGISYKELLDKYCNGVYLQHQELENLANGKITFMLKKDDRYAIYLLNPSRLLPEFTISGSNSSSLKDVVSKVNKKEKISTYIFTAGDTGEFDFSYWFNTKEDACVLMAIYLQNLTIFQPGVYNRFEEMKYNNPSSPLESKIYSRVVRLSGSQQVTYYTLDMTRNQAKDLGGLFGFSDGKYQYIRQSGGAILKKEFVRIDNYGKYGYFEDVDYILVNSVLVPYLTFNLIDMNSGDITRIDKKHLREYLAEDRKLLEAFNNESQKDKKIKEYLIRYLDSKNNE